MIAITFLKGIKPDYSASKTFKLQGGKYLKVSDYSIGQTFAHERVRLDFSHQELTTELRKRAEAHWFHIYGLSRPGLPNRAYRRKENFPEAATRMLVVDIDKYDLPPHIAQLWANDKRETITLVIREVLRELGIIPLADVDFSFVLSSSQLNRKRLSAHLYFFLDKPVGLRDLRRWAMMMAKGLDRAIIDPAIYRSVQPVYISPPTCIGFTDPFPLDTRIACSSPPVKLMASLDDLKRLGFSLTNSPVPNVGNITAAFDSYGGLVEQSQAALKRNWVDTLDAYCGTKSRGINEPSHRAAAQMVSEMGTQEVISNLDYYVKQFHQAQWSAIKRRGERGGPEDQQKYDELKSRNYIESAVNKDFGKIVDKLEAELNGAIDKALADGSTAPLLTPAILKKARILQEWAFPKYADIRKRIRENNRKLLPIAAWESRVKLASGSATTYTVDPNDTTKVVDACISKLTLIIAKDNTEYLHWLNPNKPLGYSLIALASPSLGGALTLLMRQVTAEIPNDTQLKSFQRYLFGIAEERLGIRAVTDAVVGKRIAYGDNAVYYRLGDYHGTDMTAVLDWKGVTVKKSVGLPVYWQEGEVDKVPLASPADINSQFGTETPTMAQITDYLKRYLHLFINCDKEDIPKVVTLATTLLTNGPLIHGAAFIGPSGSGKTYGASAFKRLIDPVGSDEAFSSGAIVNDLRKELDDADYNIFMSNGVVIYDQVIRLTERQQALFSQAATGSQISRRIYYTQQSQAITLKNCVILTNTTCPEMRSDLRARMLMIEFSDVRKADDKQVKKDFIKRAPMLRWCLFKVAAEFCAVSRKQAELINSITPRARVYVVVDAIMNNLEITNALVTQVEHERASGTVEFDKLLQMFIAHLEEDHQADKEVCYNPPDRYHQFLQWVRANNGEKKMYYLLHGDHIKLYETRVELLAVPDTQRAFDMRMAEAATALGNGSLWVCGKRRMGHKRLLVYKNKASEDDRLLGKIF